MERIGAISRHAAHGHSPRTDAYLDDDLTAMLQACQTLDPTAGSLVSEVWNEVVSANDLPVLENGIQRRIGRKPAMDRDRVREHLIGVVRLEIERLEEKAQAHQVRAELMAELCAPSCQVRFEPRRPAHVAV